MEKKNNEYHQSISQHDSDKLTKEEIPFKEKQVENTQALIKRHTKEIWANETVLQKTVDKLAPFSGGIAAQAVANTSAALNSDTSQKHLAEKKARLEKHIYDTKKLVAKLKNEQAVYEAQLTYAEKRAEQFNELQETYAPFLGTTQEKMSKEDGEIAQVIASTISTKNLGPVLVKSTLTAKQDHLLIQSHVDKKRFEDMLGNPVQNLIYQKLNDMLGVVAETQAKDPHNAELTKHSEVAAMLLAHGQDQNQQGNTNGALKTYKLATVFTQYIQAEASGVAGAAEKAKQEMGECLSDIVQRTHDSESLANLQNTVDEIKANADPKREKELWLGLATAFTVMTIDNPTSGPAALVVGAVAVALEAALSTRTAVVGTAVAAAAIDPKSSLLNSIDKGLKSKKSTPTKDNKGGSSTDSVGQKSKQPNGSYKEGDHSRDARGRKSPAPKNGQKALDNSILIKDTSPHRVSMEGDNFVMLRETKPGEFHGNIQTWSELDPKTQAKLIQEGICNKRGRILKRINN